MVYHKSGYGLAGPTFKVRSQVKGPEMPEPMRESLHEDIGEAISGVIGDAQAVGGKIMDILDAPISAVVKTEGPHRILDNGANMTSGLARNAVENLLGVGNTVI